MRAKNEYKFIAEAYDTKLILERVVDGTLMCPEACCGAPVMECSCGPDCPHCNCFMIQEAVKKHGLKDKRLKTPEEDEENVLSEYSLNEPQGHTGGPHYDSIEDLFAQRVERISDYGDAFDVSHFEDLKPYIANWDTLLEIIDEENTQGFSERWEEVKFKFGPKGMRSEDSEATSASFGDNKGYDGPWKNPDRERPDSGAAAEEWDRQNPKRGISGYEHKPDALVSARKAGAIHKPYVSSFVTDGGKIFGVMGSDGKIVHKTRDKQKAYKWFRDNYEDI